MSEPELTVILPVFNMAATIGEQLEALDRQAWAAPWEVLVVDNDSTDATRELVLRHRSQRLRLVSAPVVHNLSYVRNVGVRQARGRAVAFCDGDDVVGDGWVAAMGRALREHALVGCRMEYGRLNPASSLAARPPSFQTERLERVFGREVVLGAGGCQKWLWERVGGNDVTLDCGEDFDFSLRATTECGVIPHFASDALYHVRLRGTPMGLFKRWRRIGRVYPLLYRRHGVAHGPERTVPEALRMYGWLLWNLGMLGSEERRMTWLHLAGKNLGRLEGSVKHRTLFL